MLKGWKRLAAWLLNARKSVLVSRRGRSFVPMLENLEGRLTPATLHVGTGHGEFATIQAAVDAAHSGDRVLVDPGTYQEQVTINKSIDLEAASNCGHNAGVTVLAPSNLASPGAIIRVTGSNTSAQIENLTIEGGSTGTSGLLYGIRVDGGAFAEIDHNTISDIIDSSDRGLGVAIDVGNSLGSPDGTGDQVGRADIEHNVISNYQRAGIVVNHAGSTAKIQQNTIAGGAATSNNDSPVGVEISDGATGNVEHNAITGNSNGSSGAGVVIFNSGVQRLPDFDSDPNDFAIVTVKDNVISGNDYGVFGSEVTASLPDQPASADIENNKISNNTYVGIEFDNSSNVTIANNHISNNGSNNTADGGIYLYYSSNNVVRNNEVTNNVGSGLYLEGSTGNVILNNQLQGNADDGSNADAVDDSTGSGTSGTANSWVGNHGDSYIDGSGQTLFDNGHNHGPDHHDKHCHNEHRY